MCASIVNPFPVCLARVASVCGNANLRSIRSWVRSPSARQPLPRAGILRRAAGTRTTADAMRFHRDLLALAGQLRVALRLCAVRKPQHNDKVEQAIRFLRDRFFAARTIRVLDRGNAEQLAFLDEIADVRPHRR
ncbi:hypothetical protein [Sorangium sp. So ce406]|uniref:hypothetical protein n=1 Tax=Sorangium sp. So ce406 TaxID=3133311 RepID=UPI003F5C902D